QPAGTGLHVPSTKSAGSAGADEAVVCVRWDRPVQLPVDDLVADALLLGHRVQVGDGEAEQLAHRLAPRVRADRSLWPVWRGRRRGSGVSPTVRAREPPPTTARAHNQRAR